MDLVVNFFTVAYERKAFTSRGLEIDPQRAQREFSRRPTEYLLEVRHPSAGSRYIAPPRGTASFATTTPRRLPLTQVQVLPSPFSDVSVDPTEIRTLSTKVQRIIEENKVG